MILGEARWALGAALCGSLALALAGPAVAAIGPEGALTLDKPAEVWPVKRLEGDGSKKEGPVTFNHRKHGENLGCVACHHTEPALKPGDTEARSCFECHGPARREEAVDSYEMIHGKRGSCLACHRTDTKAQMAQAPQKCEQCHKAKP